VVWIQKKSVFERIEEDNVRLVQLQFTDLLGVTKSVTIPVNALEDAIEYGAWFDGSSIEGFARILESDMYLKPDRQTYALMPWLGNNSGSVARFICDVYTPEGKPFEGDPRFILKKAIGEAEEMGFVYNTGPEMEFFLFKKDNGGVSVLPHDRGSYFDLTMDDAYSLRNEMVVVLEKMGIVVESTHHEVSHGQHEISFRYGSALETADNAVTLKFALKSVAQRHGLHATFMPKPVYGVNGSGMHVHQSLYSISEKRNAFFDEGNEYGLSNVALQFIAGQLEHVRGFCAVTSPLVNSYKRLVPGFEAPVYVSWARINRSALIRVPKCFKGKSESTRIELRCPDPSSNPYLAFAVMLKAGLDGIKNGSSVPAPIEENLYEFSNEKLKDKKIGMLPKTISEAVEELKNDSVVMNALGKHACEKYVRAKEQEWNSYRAQVTKWETEKYLETY
jgi:glutamine synthetase